MASKPFLIAGFVLIAAAIAGALTSWDVGAQGVAWYLYPPLDPNQTVIPIAQGYYFNGFESILLVAGAILVIVGLKL